uniref:Mitochondrial ribosomal protein L2 n=1 Tax=Xenopus tropicalis TaxID=8364 RepID=A0A803K1J8_XENTR
MALCALARAFSALAVSSHSVSPLLFSQTLPSRGLLTTASLSNIKPWKTRTKYTINPIGVKKTGGRDHTGRIRTRGIGGGHKQLYRMVDFQRLNYVPGQEPRPFQEKVIEVRYDPCRSADIALVAGDKRKRWIIATENMQEGDLITSSGHIGRMAVSAKEGDAHPLGALPVGTLINNLEFQPGKGAQYIRAAGGCGMERRRVSETCVATVGRVSNIDHNKRIIGKAGRNRWLGIRPSSGLWKRKGGWAGRKIKPLPGLKSYVQLPSALPAPR